MPNRRAALAERSSTLRAEYSLSVTVTMTERPVVGETTRTLVPKGSQAWAAVSSRWLKRAPLEVLRPL